MFPAGGDGIHLVVDEQGQFREDNFNTAMNVLQNAGDAAKGDKMGRKGGMKEGSNCFKIVKMIMERNFAPVIVFSFSKKECEAYALQMAKLDFNSNEEKKLVDEVFNNAMMVLSPEDRLLPQVENVLPLLKRGIGIHHGGLLPILKVSYFCSKNYRHLRSIFLSWINISAFLDSFISSGYESTISHLIPSHLFHNSFLT